MVSDVYGLCDLYASGVTVGVDDRRVFYQVFSCQSNVVFLQHVCLDCSLLFVHGQTTRQSGACVSNVADVLKPAIFRGTVKLVHYVGTHEPLSLNRVVFHDQMFRLCALIVNVEHEFVRLVLAFYVFRNDVFKYPLVFLIFCVHEVAVI